MSELKKMIEEIKTKKWIYIIYISKSVYYYNL